MNKTFVLICILTTLLIVFFHKIRYDQYSSTNSGGIVQNYTTTIRNKMRFSEIDKNLVSIKQEKHLRINPTSCYNYLKKSDIYSIRKKYVSESIFNTKNYEPSEEVFGQIEDNKPWYGLKYYACAHNIKGKNAITLGDSEESRFVNTPDALVGIETGGYDYSDYETNSYCTDLRYTKILKSLKYNPYTNTIIANFKHPIGEGYFSLKGINARDFGYNYVYAEYVKKAVFYESENITNGIHYFKDFLHTGPSCGLPGGCNNGSPAQPYLDFMVKNNADVEIHLKLWRNEPKSKKDKADINYRIIMQTY